MAAADLLELATYTTLQGNICSKRPVDLTGNTDLITRLTTETTNGNVRVPRGNWHAFTQQGAKSVSIAYEEQKWNGMFIITYPDVTLEPNGFTLGAAKVANDNLWRTNPATFPFAPTETWEMSYYTTDMTGSFHITAMNGATVGANIVVNETIAQDKVTVISITIPASTDGILMRCAGATTAGSMVVFLRKT